MAEEGQGGLKQGREAEMLRTDVGWRKKKRIMREV